MKIMFVSAEVAPFSKVGGLADVVGSLPKVLEKMGHEVAIFTPLHGCIDQHKYGIEELENSKLTIDYSYGQYYFNLKMAKLPVQKMLTCSFWTTTNILLRFMKFTRET